MPSLDHFSYSSTLDNWHKLKLSEALIETFPEILKVEYDRIRSLDCWFHTVGSMTSMMKSRVN